MSAALLFIHPPGVFASGAVVRSNRLRRFKTPAFPLDFIAPKVDPRVEIGRDEDTASS